jgi:UDP-N-acetylmuramoyl-tripeptide--D-alanyl-D-alanine ligase
VLAALGALAWLTWLARPGLVAARILQIEEYEPARLWSWSRRAGWRLRRDTAVAAAICLAGGLAALLPLGAAAAWLPGVAWIAAAAWLHLAWREPPQRKALVRTSRMVRLLVAAGLLGAIVAAAVALALAAAPAPAGSLAPLLLCAAGLPLATLAVAAAVVVVEPVEIQVRAHYRRRAEAAIRQLAPAVVAVAGSYGKTSTKHAMAAMLAPHLPVLATPRSYNTLMGVTRTVNELLEPGHRVFVVEMDAYRGGEIADICRVCAPGISIVTSVGPQHLERFGTIGAIEDALLEAVEALPADGTALVSASDEPSRSLARRAAAIRPTLTYAFADEWPDADYLVSDLTMDGRGATFEWRSRATGAARTLRCPLLGRHSALNVAAALAVVELMGLPLEPSIEAAARLEPAEHRLQPIAGAGGVTVIDDSYNANPIGVRNAVEVLGLMPASRRILVTPGLVELGPLQAEENRAFGRRAAAVCDHVVLVGDSNRAALEAGLREGGLPDERVHAVGSLDEATAALGRLTGPNAVVLFCNDLPDPYLADAYLAEPAPG